jgi:hypothetical protein
VFVTFDDKPAFVDVDDVFIRKCRKIAAHPVGGQKRQLYEFGQAWRYTKNACVAAVNGGGHGYRHQDLRDSFVTDVRGDDETRASFRTKIKATTAANKGAKDAAEAKILKKAKTLAPKKIIQKRPPTVKRIISDIIKRVIAEHDGKDSVFVAGMVAGMFRRIIANNDVHRTAPGSNPFFDDKPWLLLTPKDIRDAAAKEIATAFEEGFRRRKEARARGADYRFTVQFSSKKKTNGAYTIVFPKNKTFAKVVETNRRRHDTGAVVYETRLFLSGNVISNRDAVKDLRDQRHQKLMNARADADRLDINRDGFRLFENIPESAYAGPADASGLRRLAVEIRIHRDRNGKFWVLVPIQEKVRKRVNVNDDVVAIDPGGRVPMTCYDVNGAAFEIGRDIVGHLDDIRKHHSSLQSQRDVVRNELGTLTCTRRRELKANIRKLTARMERARVDAANARDDFHWKSIKRLGDAYGTVLLPELQVKRLSRWLKAKANRDMFAISHFKLRQRFEFKHRERGFDYPDPKTVNESYTTQTCGSCGDRYRAGREVFVCGSCGLWSHRDAHAARNILIRWLASRGI